MEDRGRVVVVAAGFALWLGGRCAAAARWADVKRLRAYRRGDPPDDAVRFVVELRDGSVVEMHEEAPGLDLFLDRAGAMLGGLRPYAEWHDALVLAPPGGEGAVLYEVRTPTRRRT